MGSAATCESLDKGLRMNAGDTPLRVALGTHVEVELASEAGPPERLAFDLVPDAEADFPRGYLGVGTPLARAILGCAAGEVRSYRAAEAF